jgi:cytochrome c oxidase subunit 4
MSDAAVTTDDQPHAEVHHAHEGEAFSGHETLYIKIALLLAVLTGMEVAWPYIIDDGPVLMWPLLVMMAIKFVIIAAYFMHLKFDSVILTRIFYSGLFLAVGVYLVALITFGIFGW